MTQTEVFGKPSNGRPDPEDSGQPDGNCQPPAADQEEKPGFITLALNVTDRLKTRPFYKCMNSFSIDKRSNFLGQSLYKK